MKNFSLILFLLCTTSFLFAQTITDGEIPYEFGEATFNKSMKLWHVEETPEGLKVLTILSKKGAYRKKKGSISSGGNEELTILAIGDYLFDESLNVLKSEYTIIEPDGENAIQGDYEVLNEAGAIRAKVIATKADCKSLSELAKIYPQLRDNYGKVEPMEFEGPDVYYDNWIDYKLFSGAIKEIRVKKMTKNPKPPKADEAMTLKAAFQDMFKSTPSVKPYKEEEKVKEVEDSYRGRGKKDFWVSISPLVIDYAEGNLIAHHGHVYTKDAPRKRNSMFEQELVAFNAAGEVSGRVDLNFEKPMELTKQVLFAKEGEFVASRDVHAAGYLFKEFTGIGTKKINPNPDPKSRHFFRFNDQGKQDYAITFQVEEALEYTKWLLPDAKNESFAMLTYCRKPVSFFWYQLTSEGLAAKTAIGKEHPLYNTLKNSGLTNSNLSLVEYQEKELENGSRNLLLLVIQEMTDANTKKKSNRYHGYLSIIQDAEGGLTNASFLPRQESATLSKKPTLKLLKEEGDLLTWLYYDPRQLKVKETIFDKKHVRIFSQNKQSLESVDLLKKDDQFMLNPKSSEFIYNEEKGLLYFLMNGKIKAIRI